MFVLNVCIEATLAQSFFVVQPTFKGVQMCSSLLNFPPVFYDIGHVVNICLGCYNLHPLLFDFTLLRVDFSYLTVTLVLFDLKLLTMFSCGIIIASFDLRMDDI